MERDASGSAPARAESLTYSGFQFRFPSRYRVIWVATVLLIVIVAILEPHTFSAASLKIETPLIAVLAIASLGQLLVVTVGGFDLSVAANMTFSAALMLKLGHGANDHLVVAILVTLGCCAALGLSNGGLVSLGLNPLIVTLAMSGVIAAVTLLLTNGGVDVLSYNVPQGLSDFAGGYVGNVSNLLFVALGLVLVTAFVLRTTKAGRRLIASGTNPMAARVVGIRVRGYEVGAYVVASLLYSTAGMLLAAFLQHPDLSTGSPYLLSTFIVVALGGALLNGGPNSVLGTAIGAVFLVLLNQFLAIKGFSPGMQSLIQGIVLIVAVAAVTVVRGGSLVTTAAALLRLRNTKPAATTSGQ
jgi:ribose transport system permease protein